MSSLKEIGERHNADAHIFRDVAFCAQPQMHQDRGELLQMVEQLQAQVDRVCEWYEVSCYDELPFVVDEMCEGQISVRQETKLDAPRGLDQLAVPPDER